jgi:hypothetical protein
MRLFAHLPPAVPSPDADADAAIRGAAEAMLAAAGQLGLAATLPWSLAELAPSETDFQWLCDWAKTLTERTAYGWLTSEWVAARAAGRRLSGPAVIGAPLLLLATEAARRDAGEHRLWPHVRRDAARALRFPRADGQLFANGQPTQPHKDALEAAARQLNLRHTFDEADGQNYYVTVALQFGFSGPGFRRRLPDWLVNRECRPLAVDRLLDGPGRCGSFGRVWDLLRQFRLNNITERQLRVALGQSPWVLPEWIDELVGRATAPASVGESPPGTKPTGGTPSPGDALETFLDEPWLCWDRAPEFATRISGLADLDLTEDTYDVLVGGRRVDRLYRQPDGGYNVSPDRVYRVAADAPAVAANLVVSRGPVAATQELALWDADAEVTVYRLSDGRRLGPHDRMDPHKAYAVRAPCDLTMVPKPAEWQHCGTSTFWRLAPDWPTESALCAGDLAVWRPDVLGTPGTAAPSWAKVRVSATLPTVELGRPFYGVIEHHAEAVVRFVRTPAGPVVFVPEGLGRTTLGPLTVPPSAARAALELTIGLVCGEEAAVVRQRLSVPLRGAARLTPGGWGALDGSAALTVEEARREPVRVWPPGGAILDGDVWVRTPTDRPKPIGECLGLGERLTWRHDPYDVAAPRLVLAGEVTDRGIIRDVRRSPGDDGWQVQLFEPNEPDAESSVVWWDRSGRYATCRPDPGHGLDATWAIDAPDGLTAPAVVAAAGAGAWLGSWWSPDWPHVLLAGTRKFGSRTAAQLARWFRLPVLARHASDLVRQFALANPVEVLTAWLFDDAPADLRWPTRANGWLPAVASLFRSWRPSDAEVMDLLHNFASVSSDLGHDDELPAPVKLGLLLGRVDPLLMARVVRRLQAGTSEPLSALVGYFLAARGEAKDGGGFDQAMMDETVRAFRLEDYTSEPFDDQPWANQLAVRVARDEPFRIRLAIRLLDSLSAPSRR